jgi:hypothetical protein
MVPCAVEVAQLLHVQCSYPTGLHLRSEAVAVSADSLVILPQISRDFQRTLKVNVGIVQN